MYQLSLWLRENRDMSIEALRIYLGFGLMLKGFQFIYNKQLSQEIVVHMQIPFLEFISIHAAVAGHLVGGLLLTIGLLTRAAALVQVPLLVGAIFLVHWQQGIFQSNQNLEFVILVLFLLLVFSIYGGGRLSVDYALRRRAL
jgi:putative oxidoreductase